ncbi:Cytochrome P450 86B1 [Triticum urartu]|uniref:Cytochrome P450 86B1 n=1 Tax=Triticum urartu TaxID=4572 RepID=M7Y7J8_TRIUA|nr:Cytochrome P450 86B1 [Triticum urartu]
MSIMFSQELLISTLAIILVPLYTLYLRSSRSKNPSVLPTNWPIVGVLPYLIANFHNLHDYLAAVLAEAGHNFRAHGPPGTGMRFFLTCDPANVRHIFTTNHTNFPKGAEFAAIFDIAGGSFFTTEGEPWRRQRARAQRVLSNPRLLAGMTGSCRDKVENGLLPVLMHMASTATPFDLQDLTTRLVFDMTAAPLFGVDPGLLSPDMPPMDAAAAMDTVMEVALFRHTVPASCWKAMRRLNIGPERKLAAAHTVLGGFIEEMMERRKKKEHVANEGDPSSVDILSSYIDDPDYQQNDGLLHATLINYMIAGRDTIGTALTWVFYNLAQNPHVMSAIRNELSPIASRKAATGANNSSTMMNTIVAAMVWNFDVEVVEGHRVQPKMSCVLQMKNGLMNHKFHMGVCIRVPLRRGVVQDTMEDVVARPNAGMVLENVRASITGSRTTVGGGGSSDRHVDSVILYFL